jgi:hypothetical protein
VPGVVALTQDPGSEAPPHLRVEDICPLSIFEQQAAALRVDAQQLCVPPAEGGQTNP